MSFAREDIDYNFENPSQKTWEGEYPKLDFINDVFTGNNWNDQRLVVLRASINSLVDVDDERKFKFDGGFIEIKHELDECQHCVDIEVVTKSRNDIYKIEWYKNRGRTELVSLNGDPITIDGLRELLYLINDCETKL